MTAFQQDRTATELLPTRHLAVVRVAHCRHRSAFQADRGADSHACRSCPRRLGTRDLGCFWGSAASTSSNHERRARNALTTACSGTARRRRLQSLRLGTLEFTSAAILAGSALATGYDCDHSSEPSDTATIFTVRLCAGLSTAPQRTYFE